MFRDNPTACKFCVFLVQQQNIFFCTDIVELINMSLIS